MSSSTFSFSISYQVTKLTVENDFCLAQIKFNSYSHLEVLSKKVFTTKVSSKCFQLVTSLGLVASKWKISALS